MDKYIIICDLDGTLCNHQHRVHCVIGDKKNFDAFDGACMKDTPNVDVIEALTGLYDYLTKKWQFNRGRVVDKPVIFLFSARSDKYRQATQNWLALHNVPHGLLMMRPAGNNDKDADLKKSWLTKLRIRPEHIHTVFDDRNSVVDMWRSLGIRCLQVAPGDF